MKTKDGRLNKTGATTSKEPLSVLIRQSSGRKPPVKFSSVSVHHRLQAVQLYFITNIVHCLMIRTLTRASSYTWSLTWDCYNLHSMKPKILFLCTGNAFRSQMAEGFARAFFGDIVEVFSAGTIAEGLSKTAVTVMAEEGIDISSQRSKSIDELLSTHSPDSFSLVVTLCGDARDKCPTFPADVKHLHFDIDDITEVYESKDELLKEARRIRDDIKKKLLEIKDTIVSTRQTCG